MPTQVSISDDSIKLGQFLKLASLVDSGGQAKEAIADGRVSVNDDDLVIPHPLMHERPFVMVPLREINEDV